MMLSKDLASTPGDRFQYVNIGYHLLALIIEKVTQMEYEEFLVEELFIGVARKHVHFIFGSLPVLVCAEHQVDPVIQIFGNTLGLELLSMIKNKGL